MDRPNGLLEKLALRHKLSDEDKLEISRWISNREFEVERLKGRERDLVKQLEREERERRLLHKGYGATLEQVREHNRCPWCLGTGEVGKGGLGEWSCNGKCGACAGSGVRDNVTAAILADEGENDETKMG
jgi:hypothetical protein